MHLSNQAPGARGKATAIPRTQYDKLRPRLQKAMQEVLSDVGLVGSSLETRLNERLKGANDMSVTCRREAFWSRVGITLKGDELEALATKPPRNGAHRRTLRGAAATKKMQKLLFQVQMVRTLVNRAILSLLGYRGPVLNYLVGTNMRWEHFEQRLPSVFGMYGAD